MICFVTSLIGTPISIFMAPREIDGVLQLDDVAKELTHESFVCDTRDHEDHTFCGVMFTCACATSLPLEYLEVQSVAVRGQLGRMSVWTTRDSIGEVRETQSAWEQVYDGHHDPSPDELVTLQLASPIRLRPGEEAGLYIHSAEPGDEGLVYDNQRSRHHTYKDRCFEVHPGLAHLSNRPFGKHGLWGRPWRVNREFVGSIKYGVRWQMWSPTKQLGFPIGFQRAVLTMMMASRRPESLVYLLQDEVSSRSPETPRHVAHCADPPRRSACARRGRWCSSL